MQAQPPFLAACILAVFIHAVLIASACCTYWPNMLFLGLHLAVPVFPTKSHWWQPRHETRYKVEQK